MVALFLIILFIFLYIIPVAIPGPVFGIILFLFCFDALFIVYNTKRFYNWGIAFILIILIAIFFRRMRWPLTGVLFTIGYSGLAIYSYFTSFIFLRKTRGNNFLKYVGFASSLILSFVCIGILFKSMHWPLGGIILNSGLVLFIPFLFAFVFTLPGSNYIGWNQTERAVFFRVIVIPMTFIYVLCVLMLPLNELWTELTRPQLIPFEMYDFELFKKPGLH